MNESKNGEQEEDGRMDEMKRSFNELQDKIAAFRRCINVKDRTYHLRSYKNVFVGSEAVEALVASKAAATKAEAVQLGNELMFNGLFSHVVNQHSFKDEFLFYRLNADDNHLVQIGDGFWNIRGSFSAKVKFITLAEIGTHMSIVRKSNNRFIVIDAIDLSPGAREEFNKLTDSGKLVDAVLFVHPFHSIWTPLFFQLYPNAAYYGTPRHLHKFKQIPWAGDLQDPAVRKRFEPDLLMSIPDGCEFANPKPPAVNHISSVVVFHPQSETLHVDDTICFWVNPNWLQRLGGTLPGKLAWHLSKGFALTEPLQFVAWVQTLLQAWKFNNMCTAHSGNKIGGAKEELQELLSASIPMFESLESKQANLRKKRESMTPHQLKEVEEEIQRGLNEAMKSCHNLDGDECG